MSKSFKIILYFLLTFLLFIIFGNSPMFFEIILIYLVAIGCIEFTRYKRKKNKNSNAIKICKYCKSEINNEATVCPNCKRGLTFNTNTGVLVVLIVIIGLLILGIFSNNAPLFMRKTVCGLGIRNDFPYCYYVDFNN